jgi:MGT family glycosyltransferase
VNIGVIAPESHSHVATATNVGRELAARGHRVVYFGFEDVRAVPEAAGLEFVPIASAEYPVGAVDRMMQEVREASGLRSSLLTVKALGELLDCRLRHLPGLMGDAGIEGLVSDQISPAAGTVCHVVGIPFVNICNALHMNYDYGVPPFFTGWSSGDSRIERVRNRLGYAFFDAVRRSMRKRVNRFRAAHGLAPFRGPHAGMSTLLQVSQLVPELDYRYSTLPAHFHYAGPLGDLGSAQKDEGLEDELDGRPLVYCSFGTVNNSQHPLYDTVLAAFHDIDAQLVLSLGGSDVDLRGPLPAGAIVRRRVPQRWVLERSRGFITHAGVNSALEALWFGVPMVCVPIANDQPGVAARLAHHGAALSLSPRRLARDRLVSSVRNVIADPRFRHRTKRLREAVRAAPGARGAAALIEDKLARGAAGTSWRGGMQRT